MRNWNRIWRDALIIVLVIVLFCSANILSSAEIMKDSFTKKAEDAEGNIPEDTNEITE